MSGISSRQTQRSAELRGHLKNVEYCLPQVCVLSNYVRLSVADIVTANKCCCCSRSFVSPSSRSRCVCFSILISPPLALSGSGRSISITLHSLGNGIPPTLTSPVHPFPCNSALRTSRRRSGAYMGPYTEQWELAKRCVEKKKKQHRHEQQYFNDSNTCKTAAATTALYRL